MKGKLFLFLFALPFFGVGVWMAWSAGSNIADSWHMQQWTPVQAMVISGGYETHSGDDSNTYEAYADYEYGFGGQTYRNNRVAIAGGADNIGDYQQDLGRRLGSARDSGEGITVYVNPDDPADAIVDRSVRWGLIGFKSIFIFVFGGVGLGLIIFAFKSPKAKDLSAPEYRDQPWLANDHWQTPVLKSNSKAAMWGAWVFAAFWNLISAPLPFMIYTEVTEKDNLPALLGLMFPLVGAGLIIWAVARTLEWRRFGPAPVVLDPFPGAIGGHVGGTIDVNLPYDSASRFSLTLTSLHSYMSGSGKNRSRTESAEWQDSQVAHLASGARGTRLSFRFDVPEDLRQSDADQSDDSYYLWRLNLHAELPGVDIDRNYEIPVYPTSAKSAQLSGLSMEHARGEQKQLNIEAIETLVQLGHGAGGRTMLFPMGRNLLSGFGGLIFGAIFAGVGWYLLNYEGHPFMGAVFGGVGLLIAAFALYMVLNSLEVMQVGGEIRTVRRICGIPVKRARMRLADFVRFSKTASSTSRSGNKHIILYSVFAVDRGGRELVLGEGFNGASQADAAADIIARQFGLTPEKKNSRGIDTTTDDYDVLATD